MFLLMALYSRVLCVRWCSSSVAIESGVVLLFPGQRVLRGVAKELRWTGMAATSASVGVPCMFAFTPPRCLAPSLEATEEIRSAVSGSVSAHA